MSSNPARNQPCPCGSGIKYKHCHGRTVNDEASPRDDDSAGAAEIALTWLLERHRKAMQASFADLLFEDLWPDDGPDPSQVDEDSWRMIMTNVNEWLLAEGDFEVKGISRDINPYVLSEAGPRLTAGQRRWIAQLAGRALRLYSVTEVRRGQGFTLVDAIDAQAEPIEVRERLGSESARAGMLIGCRVMTVDDHLELSGAIYPFSVLSAPSTKAAVRGVLDHGHHPDDVPYATGMAIMRAWVHQMVGPPILPTMVDASSGEPLLLITDHYQVLDEAALADSLGRCDDVQSGSAGGWSRTRDDNGLTRSLAAINRGKADDRVEIFYRTQSLADAGRAWFEQAAGTAVRYLTREIVDPKGALSKGLGQGSGEAPTASPIGDLPPEVIAEAIEKMVLRTYAHWADEPIPALDGRTPRQAIASPAGLERVKGLLRSYEDGEADMARGQGRRAISYQFLWDALQIQR